MPSWATVANTLSELFKARKKIDKLSVMESRVE